jgi:Flp pilus assembly CpaF family ATPase
VVGAADLVTEREPDHHRPLSARRSVPSARMLNALCAGIPARECTVTGEVSELQPQLPDVVAMQTKQTILEGTGEIPLRRLVKEPLRMRPSRLMG